MIVFVLIYDLFIFRVRGSHGDSRGRMGMGSGMEDGRGEGRGGGVGLEGEEWGSWVDELLRFHLSINIKLTSVLHMLKYNIWRQDRLHNISLSFLFSLY